MVNFYETSGHSTSQPYVTALSKVNDDVCLRQTPMSLLMDARMRENPCIIRLNDEAIVRDRDCMTTQPNYEFGHMVAQWKIMTARKHGPR